MPNLARSAASLPSFEEMSSVFDLDKNTGQVKWKIAPNGATHAGAEAGSLKPSGYRVIGAFRKTFKAHRVVWLLSRGYWPDCAEEVDHIDGNKCNNRPENLRLATRAINMQNQRCARKDNKSGSSISGVSFHARDQKYVALLRISGVKPRQRGFKLLADAEAQALAWRREFMPGNTL